MTIGGSVKQQRQIRAKGSRQRKKPRTKQGHACHTERTAVPGKWADSGCGFKEARSVEREKLASEQDC